MKMKNTALLSFLPLVNGNPPKSIVAHGHWCGFVKRAFIKTAGCGAAFVLVPWPHRHEFIPVLRQKVSFIALFQFCATIRARTAERCWVSVWFSSKETVSVTGKEHWKYVFISSSANAEKDDVAQGFILDEMTQKCVSKENSDEECTWYSKENRCRVCGKRRFYHIDVSRVAKSKQNFQDRKIAKIR